LSGSGSSLFTLYDEAAQATAAARFVTDQHELLAMAVELGGHCCTADGELGGQLPVRPNQREHCIIKDMDKSINEANAFIDNLKKA